MKKLNILVFSHTSSFGGAEQALIDLVALLKADHKVSVVFPSIRGDLVDYFKSQGHPCLDFPLGFALPNTGKFILDYSTLDQNEFVTQMVHAQYDLIISNTIVSLHGMFLAKAQNIPCIVYAHEHLPLDEDLQPHGCSGAFYLKLVQEHSNHILCASEYVQSSFYSTVNTSILYPLNGYGQTSIQPKVSRYKLALNSIKDFCTASKNKTALSLLVIGNKSLRKNSHFALTVLKALRLRGLNVNLHLIGSNSTGTNKLAKQIKLRREKNVHTYSHRLDPYALGNDKRINLVCANNEPFGLTITESLYRGIPVVAPKCGGPQELLSEAFLYDKNNIDECVRAIERIASDYESCIDTAKNLYASFNEKNNLEQRRSTLSRAIESAIRNFHEEKYSSASLDPKSFKHLTTIPISKAEILRNISEASHASEQPTSVEEIEKLIIAEKKQDGHAVLSDIKRFDVVPFSQSKNMDLLYKNGLGLAIELLANISDAGKIAMMSYILMSLFEKQSTLSQKINVLFLGDGLGVDSLKIATCGFSVDYIDFDASLISQCATLNFASAKAVDPSLDLHIVQRLTKHYDAVVCLEVIEHVADPQGFLKFIHDHMAQEGVLLMSDCFDGVYDRWPTHLYSNEVHAAELPILAAPYFELIDINRSPYAKPYKFKKRSVSDTAENALQFFKNPLFLREFIRAKEKIGY